MDPSRRPKRGAVKEASLTRFSGALADLVTALMTTVSPLGISFMIPFSHPVAPGLADIWGGEADQVCMHLHSDHWTIYLSYCRTAWSSNVRIGFNAE